MMPRYLFWGIIPAVCYAVLAGVVGLSEVNCGSLLFCGYAFFLLTYPSQLTLGKFLEDRGITIHFTSSPELSDYAQIALHVAFCAVLVFMVCYSFTRFIVWLNNYNESLNDRDQAQRRDG